MAVRKVNNWKADRWRIKVKADYFRLKKRNRKEW